jgi:peptidoglycan hydrolase-like protein with peptidoglycan-binding domain
VSETTRDNRWLTVAVLAAVAAGACSGRGHTTTQARGKPRVAATTTTTAVPTTTTAAPTTTTAVPTTKPPPKPLPGLGPGARGQVVLDLEKRLDAQRYDVGAVDGVFDGNTTNAVMAFQKVHGFGRTGRATDQVLLTAATSGPPGPLVPGGGATRVEVDIPRQVLFLYQGDALFRILPVSTGNGSRFCVDGRCTRAVTPGGAFRVTRRVSGWDSGPLGRLHNPLYFNGGIAIHGATSVPAYPASHGCVRIPMSASPWMPSRVPNGTPVYVKGGPNAPPPFSEPVPPTAPPPPPTAPPTTAPPTTTTPPTTTSTTSP